MQEKHQHLPPTRNGKGIDPWRVLSRHLGIGSSLPDVLRYVVSEDEEEKEEKEEEEKPSPAAEKRPSREEKNTAEGGRGSTVGVGKEAKEHGSGKHVVRATEGVEAENEEAIKEVMMIKEKLVQEKTATLPVVPTSSQPPQDSTPALDMERMEGREGSRSSHWMRDNGSQRGTTRMTSKWK